MKKLFFCGLIALFIGVSSFTAHKFYVAIYQINYAPEKKMIQVTSRIFVDDLNEALSKEYKTKTFIGDKSETPADVGLMQKYISEHFTLRVNSVLKTMNFRSHELENNVVICYFTITEATKIKSVEIQNTVLTTLFPEQQNIIQINILDQKGSVLLNAENAKGIFRY